MDKEQKLKYWQDKFSDAKGKYQAKLEKMEEYDQYLNGTKAMPKIGKGNATQVQQAFTVRNIVYELIEAQVDNSIPLPKVTATKEFRQRGARKLENKLRCEIDRLPFEYMNDTQERVCPTQGGSIFWVEWDNTKRTHNTVGELSVRLLHPKQFIPQPGIFEIEEMDYMFVLVTQTKAYIKQRFNVDIEKESETDANANTFDKVHSDDKVTQVICYYRNDDGGIGKFSWANDTVLEDFEDYQERKQKVCKRCGSDVSGDKCEACGSKKTEMVRREHEILQYDVKLGEKTMIPKGTKIKHYTPNIYPVIVRRNVSAFGSFLGKSDVEVIKDQQDNIKKLNSSILEKVLTGGSFVTLPKGVKVRLSDENFKILELDDPSKKALIDVITVQPNISQDMNMMSLEYEIARQELGITDSFQGRKDPTATSGKAKEFSAAQSAGRLESKRTMKAACYGALYEAMAKFLIAFCDEPRDIITEDDDGNPLFEEFSKYDFLELDEAGECYYNTDYLFSTDVSSTLANNREAMWQETRMNLTQGAFGDPQEASTLLFFWQIMESLHYPGAGKMKKQMQSRLNQEQQMMQMQNQIAQMQNQMAQMQEQMGGMDAVLGQVQGENEQLAQKAAALETDNVKLSEGIGQMFGMGANNNAPAVNNDA